MQRLECECSMAKMKHGPSPAQMFSLSPKKWCITIPHWGRTTWHRMPSCRPCFNPLSTQHRLQSRLPVNAFMCSAPSRSMKCRRTLPMWHSPLPSLEHRKNNTLTHRTSNTKSISIQKPWYGSPLSKLFHLMTTLVFENHAWTFNSVKQGLCLGLQNISLMVKAFF